MGQVIWPPICRAIRRCDTAPRDRVCKGSKPMLLSVVLPLFNEADNIDPLYARLAATLDRIACDYELIFVNDGSSDGSLDALERLADSDRRVKYLSLSRNFGHEIASTAGL